MLTNLNTHKLIDRLPWILASRIRRYYPSPIGFYFVISKAPLIILIPEDFFDEEWLWRPMFDALKNRKVYFIGLVRSGIECDQGYKQLLTSVLTKQSHNYPKHRFIFLANNAAQSKIFNEIGLESVFANQNCLFDETLIQVDDNTPKQFDAIYNAVSAPYKRLELAQHIESLAIITAFSERHLSYFHDMATLLNHAKWLNFPENHHNCALYRRIPHQEIYQYLSQARVGLCLSHVEGAMFASIEYLLSGSPVVSTLSYGGRDEFFDDEYVEIVEANPDAVKEGVIKMIKKNPDPHIIRSATLSKMKDHRQRFVDMVMEIAKREGIETTSKDIYTGLFPNQFYKLRQLQKVLDYV